MTHLQTFSTLLGFAALSIAAGYSIMTLLALCKWKRQTPTKTPEALPPVTLLKPLCGAEPGLYEHLRGFCRQDYPHYQIIFGVRDPTDPACEVVAGLIREHPDLPIELVIDPRQHGCNLKVSNLINMLERAHHDLLVVADSDAFAGPDYLGIVTAPLHDPAVGLVTCAYQSVPTDSLWSRLGAMYINEWYVPSVLLAWLCGYEGYVSGQTLCIRQRTLRDVGGLNVIADQLADDHRLGELVSGLGLRIVLSPYLVQAEHHEQDFAALARHETRWMRTIRVLRPLSFRLIFLSFVFPLGTFGLLLALAGSSHVAAAWSLAAVTAAVRLVFHILPRLRWKGSVWGDLWLLPLRDFLLCGIWFRSFFTSRITWRGSEFDVDADGLMRRLT